MIVGKNQYLSDNLLYERGTDFNLQRLQASATCDTPLTTLFNLNGASSGGQHSIEVISHATEHDVKISVVAFVVGEKTNRQQDTFIRRRFEARRESRATAASPRALILF